MDTNEYRNYVDNRLGDLHSHIGRLQDAVISMANKNINMTITGDVASSNVDIDGGAIDGTNIGATTAGTGRFTTLTGNLTSSNVDITGGAIDGTNIGATARGTGAFTTLTGNTVGGFSHLSSVGGGGRIDIVVTVAAKTTAHRYYSTGSASGYLLDGVQAPYLTLTPGITYRFTQDDSSNSGHPLKFYRDAAKTTEYTTNVTIQGSIGSAGAYTQIAVDENTPPVIFYQCSSHSYMGNGLSMGTGATDTNDLSNGAGFITASSTENLSNKTLISPTITGAANLSIGQLSDVDISALTTSAVRQGLVYNGTHFSTEEILTLTSSGNPVNLHHDSVDCRCGANMAFTFSPTEQIIYAQGSQKLKVHNTGLIVTGELSLTNSVGGATIRFPTVDGSAGQVLQTDGGGSLSWVTPQIQKLCVRLYLNANQNISNNVYIAIPMVPDTDVNLGGYSNVLVSETISGSGTHLNGPGGAAVYRFIAPKNGVYRIAGNTQVDAPYETGHTLTSVIYKCDSDDSNAVWVKGKKDEDRLHFGNSTVDATNTGNFNGGDNNSAFNKRTHELQDTVYLTQGQKVWMAVRCNWWATNHSSLVLGANTGYASSMTVTEI